MEQSEKCEFSIFFASFQWQCVEVLFSFSLHFKESRPRSMAWHDFCVGFIYALTLYCHCMHLLTTICKWFHRDKSWRNQINFICFGFVVLSLSLSLPFLLFRLLSNQLSNVIFVHFTIQKEYCWIYRLTNWWHSICTELYLSPPSPSAWCNWSHSKLNFDLGKSDQ